MNRGLENSSPALDKVVNGNWIANAKDKGDVVSLVRGIKDVALNDRPILGEEESVGEGQIAFHLHTPHCTALWYPLLIFGKFALFPQF